MPPPNVVFLLVVWGTILSVASYRRIRELQRGVEPTPLRETLADVVDITWTALRHIGRFGLWLVRGLGRTVTPRRGEVGELRRAGRALLRGIGRFARWVGGVAWLIISPHAREKALRSAVVVHADDLARELAGRVRLDAPPPLHVGAAVFGHTHDRPIRLGLSFGGVVHAEVDLGCGRSGPGPTLRVATRALAGACGDALVTLGPTTVALRRQATGPYDLAADLDLVARLDAFAGAVDRARAAGDPPPLGELDLHAGPALRLIEAGGVDHRCPWCHDRLHPDLADACRVCATPHHPDCLVEAGCAATGCAGRLRVAS